MQNRIINEVEVKSFLKYWLKYNKVKGNGIEKINLFKDIILSFLANRSHVVIYGVDKIKGFEIHLADESDLIPICKDIWIYPEKYYELKPNQDPYYDFLKFLWINENTRLADVINEIDQQESKKVIRKYKCNDCGLEFTDENSYKLLISNMSSSATHHRPIDCCPNCQKFSYNIIFLNKNEFDSSFNSKL